MLYFRKIVRYKKEKISLMTINKYRILFFFIFLLYGCGESGPSVEEERALKKEEIRKEMIYAKYPDPKFYSDTTISDVKFVDCSSSGQSGFPDDDSVFLERFDLLIPASFQYDTTEENAVNKIIFLDKSRYNKIKHSPSLYWDKKDNVQLYISEIIAYGSKESLLSLPDRDYLSNELNKGQLVEGMDSWYFHNSIVTTNINGDQIAIYYFICPLGKSYEYKYIEYIVPIDRVDKQKWDHIAKTTFESANYIGVMVPKEDGSIMEYYYRGMY